MIHFKQAQYYDLWNTGKFKGIEGDKRSDVPTTLTHQVCWVILLSFFIIVYLLNLFWYSIILRGLIKLMKGDMTAGGRDKIKGIDTSRSSEAADDVPDSPSKATHVNNIRRNQREKIE